MSTHSPKEFFFFLIEFKNTASICKIMVSYTKSANEKCLPGDVFVLTMVLCMVLTYGYAVCWLKSGVQNWILFFCSWLRH